MIDLHTHKFEAMGSPCGFHFHSESIWQAEDTAVAGWSEVCRIEQKYSRFVSNNILDDINHAAKSGRSVTVDEETAELLDFAFSCFRTSGGLFDITSGVLRSLWDFKSGRLPDPEAIARLRPLIGMEKVRWDRPRLGFDQPGMQLDFSGIAKEYTTDRVCAVFSTAGAFHCLVDLGGDLAANGPHPDGTAWRIGIKDPSDTMRSLATVLLSKGGIATSGDYENNIVVGGKRFGHLLNPKTGWPTSGLVSATALAPSCMAAGAAASIAMLKGSDGPRWLGGTRLPFLVVETTGRQTNALPRIYP
jgi:thiamine biosynthesis lipoprotein